jgi:hypothetical protein
MSAEVQQFVVDSRGKKKAIVLPIKRYEKLLADLHDLAIVAEGKDEVAIPLEEMKKRLKRDGLL